jgi:glycosyltransferase involved in cell wall biosynthesis
VVEALSIIKDRNFISNQNRPLSLVIAGADYSGYTSHVKSIAEKLGVSDQVIFLGFVPYEQLPALYHEARVFVFLSLCESFGLPILEAMACGCPVVCSNVSSLPEVAGDAAILVDPEDPVETADAIEAILKDYEYRRRLIYMGKIRIREFSWNRTASQTLSVLQQSVKGRSGRI